MREKPFGRDRPRLAADLARLRRHTEVANCLARGRDGRVTACRLYTGRAKTHDGYAILWAWPLSNGWFVFSRKMSVRAHRWRYLLHYGSINATLDHLCGNEHCVALNHLEDVTNLENQRRKIRRMLRLEIRLPRAFYTDSSFDGQELLRQAAQMRLLS